MSFSCHFLCLCPCLMSSRNPWTSQLTNRKQFGQNLHNNLLATQCYTARSMLINKHLGMQRYQTASIMSPQCAGSVWDSKSQITDTSSLLPYTYHQHREEELNSRDFWIRIAVHLNVNACGLWVSKHLRPNVKTKPETLWSHELNYQHRKDFQHTESQLW